MKNVIHWCKPKSKWTSHTYKSCAKASRILVSGEWSVETKPHYRSNPKGWVVTDHSNVILDPQDDLVNNFVVQDRLIYSKSSTSFNIQSGTALLFTEEGCQVLTRR